jgi:hypothetical protein
VCPRNHFEAAPIHGSVIEGGPELQLGLVGEPPEPAAVLVPRQIAAAGLALVEEDGAVDDDVAGDPGVDDTLEEGVLQPGAEARIQLQLLELAVVERGPLPAEPQRCVLVAAGGCVELEEEARVRHAPEHELIRALAQGGQARVVQHHAQARVAMLGVVGERRVHIEALRGHAQHVHLA